MRYQRSSQLFLDANLYIPGGVNSPVRAFKSVGGTPVFIKSAKGAYLTDEDNNLFIDYINSWGPMILGHSHPEVVQAIKNQTEKGFSFGTPTELETEIAKLIIESVPNIDKVRMVSSGTEACMSAVRLARGFTGKHKIIKFEGCYHGHSDSFLIKAGSGAATFGNPNSPGVTPGTAQDTLLAKFNDLEQVKNLFDKNPQEIAAIILEPVAGNMGCVLPQENFLKGLRDLCDKNNALLIFDEVMTGFRFAMGGIQEFYSINADLVTFGKVIGGGLPVGAFAGRKEIMDCLAPIGAVYQAGTLSGNPIAMTAGFKTLSILKNNPQIFSKINNTTQILAEKINEILISKGVEHTYNQVGSMLSIFFGNEKVIDFDSASRTNHQEFNKFFHGMLNQGIYLPPSSYETWFISNEINDKEIDQTLEAVKKCF